MQNLSVAARLCHAAAPFWEKCLNHPFVQSLGEGTLPVEKFRYFMLQDYLYLYEYARVFALGVAGARAHELMRIFAESLNSILNGEMNIHRAYMQRLGMDAAQLSKAKPALDNLAYTSYMRSIASAGTSVEIATSVLACSWSYAEIGRKLAEIPGAAQHPFYGEWIQGYASEEYADANCALIELLNRLALDADEALLNALEEIFVNCSRYELRFWDMAWEMRL